jgi:hypothetical protein
MMAILKWGLLEGQFDRTLIFLAADVIQLQPPCWRLMFLYF